MESVKDAIKDNRIKSLGAFNCPHCYTELGYVSVESRNVSDTVKAYCPKCEFLWGLTILHITDEKTLKVVKELFEFDCKDSTVYGIWGIGTNQISEEYVKKYGLDEVFWKMCPRCNVPTVKYVTKAITISEQHEKNAGTTCYWYCIRCHNRYDLKNGKLLTIYK